VERPEPAVLLMSLILPPCSELRRHTTGVSRQFTECSRKGHRMASTYHDEVIIKVRANLDSTMVTRLFTDNPIAS
jgi:hypothetical protein